MLPAYIVLASAPMDMDPLSYNTTLDYNLRAGQRVRSEQASRRYADIADLRDSLTTVLFAHPAVFTRSRVIGAG